MTQQVFDVRRKLQSVPKNGIGWLLRYEMLPQNASLMFNFYRYPANGALQVQPVNPMDTDAFDALFPGVISVDCSLSGNEISAILRCPTLRRRPTLLKKLADGFLQAAEEIATETNFAGQRADAADAYNDNALTYGELSVLDAIFNGVDENE